MKTSIMDTLKGSFTRTKEFWTKQDKKKKSIIIGAILAAAVTAITMAVILNHENYVSLYSGLDLAEAGEITSKLDEMGVNYKIKGASVIMVPEKQEAEVKMALASEGYPKSTLNYDLFSNNSGFMTTDYEKRQYLVFQLQDRLQGAIKTIQGIDNAIVTISLPDEDSFVLQEDKVPATASVILTLNNGTQLDRRQIKGIEALVSKSVPDLQPKDVAIIDDQGTMLNNSYASEGEAVAYTKLEIEKNISNVLEARLSKLFTPIFGTGGFRVAVNTFVDTSKRQSEEITYSPSEGKDEGMVSRKSTAKQTSGKQSGASGVAGTGSNTVPNYTETTTGEDDNSDHSETDSTDYLVNQLKEQVKQDGYDIEKISAVVLLGQEIPKSQAESYKEMAAFAVGIGTDDIVISTAPFLNTDKVVPAQANPAAKQSSTIIGIIACGILLLFILLMFLTVHKKKSKHKKEKLPLDKGDPKLKEMFGTNNLSDDIPGQIVLNETREQALKRQLKEFSSSNPEIIAQMIRTWIKEDNANG